MKSQPVRWTRERTRLGNGIVKLRIADLPEQDRPRERLWRLGPDALADRELLAILLGAGTRGLSAVTLADAILADRGGLHALARATPDDLVRLPGVGVAKASGLVAALELARRLSQAHPSARPVVRAPADLAALVRPELAGRLRERVLVVVLDRGGRADRVIPLSSGSADRSLLPVRDVLQAVLRCDGVAFALAHNHPAGDPSPSPQDLAATRRVQEAAPLVGLRFLDHLIVGEDSWFSLRESGLLELSPDNPTDRPLGDSTRTQG
jgi:DNA repair protein RadC